MKEKNYYFLGACLLFFAVAFGAFGAHGLEKIASVKGLKTFKTGVTYHYYHSFGIIILGLIKGRLSIDFKKELILFIVGIFVFSGGCYLYALTQIKAFAMIVPLGGICFLLGWLILAVRIKSGNRELATGNR